MAYYGPQFHHVAARLRAIETDEQDPGPLWRFVGDNLAEGKLVVKEHQLTPPPPPPTPVAPDG